MPLLVLLERNIQGSYVGSLANMKELMALVRDGKIDPKVPNPIISSIIINVKVRIPIRLVFITFISCSSQFRAWVKR